MKKFFLLLCFSISLSVYAQEQAPIAKFKYYLRLLDEYSSMSGSVVKVLDQNNKSSLVSLDVYLCDENGETIKFNNFIHVLNFFSKHGWTPLTLYGDGAIIYKEVSDENEALNAFNLTLK